MLLKSARIDMKIRISIRAARLKNVAGMLAGKSNPYAVVSIPNSRDEKPLLLGKTEV